VRGDRARRIALYSVRVYCHWTRECSDFQAQFNTTFIVKYHHNIIIITIYLRPQTRYFMHQARPCSAMPNRFARTLTHAHNLHAVRKRTQCRKATKTILCLIYMYTRPSSAFPAFTAVLCPFLH